MIMLLAPNVCKTNPPEDAGLKVCVSVGRLLQVSMQFSARAGKAERLPAIRLGQENEVQSKKLRSQFPVPQSIFRYHLYAGLLPKPKIDFDDMYLS